MRYKFMYLRHYISLYVYLFYVIYINNAFLLILKLKDKWLSFANIKNRAVIICNFDNIYFNFIKINKKDIISNNFLYCC